MTSRQKRVAQGELLLDGLQVDYVARDAYRQLFLPVLSDFHLFEELPDTDATPTERDAAAQAALERPDLVHKLSVQAGRLDSTDLSTGQRKRLAMVHAWAEAKPVMVFDEWAADQDPAFRKRFYREFLPMLREQGHTCGCHLTRRALLRRSRPHACDRRRPAAGDCGWRANAVAVIQYDKGRHSYAGLCRLA